jgi:hypothetical protein
MGLGSAPMGRWGGWGCGWLIDGVGWWCGVVCRVVHKERERGRERGMELVRRGRKKKRACVMWNGMFFLRWFY